MADNDMRGDAWMVPPSRYIRSRPATHKVTLPKSIYLKMKDDCRLAIDLYLPDGDGKGRASATPLRIELLRGGGNASHITLPLRPA